MQRTKLFSWLMPFAVALSLNSYAATYTVTQGG
jgi:hypothetical protein